MNLVRGLETAKCSAIIGRQSKSRQNGCLWGGKRSQLLSSLTTCCSHEIHRSVKHDSDDEIADRREGKRFHDEGGDEHSGNSANE